MRQVRNKRKRVAPKYVKIVVISPRL